MAQPQPVAVDPTNSWLRADATGWFWSVPCRVEDFVSDIVMDSATGAVLQARLDFSFSDVSTGRAHGDARLHQWQRSEQFDAVSFELTAPAVSEAGRWTANGVLAIHDVRRLIAFPVAVTRDGERVAIDGQASLDVRDFGLRVPSRYHVLRMNPRVTVHFHIQGKFIAQ